MDPISLPCGSACAGFPSPAEEHLDAPLDLRALMAPDRASDFVEPCGAPWACGGAGLLVARAGMTPMPGDAVVAHVDGRRRVVRAGRDPRGPLVGADGRGLRCAEATVIGVATWAARSHAGAAAPLDLAGLVGDRAATYLFRVSGWSMRDAGIHDGDVLVVDRSVRPAHGHAVVASARGGRSVKRLVVEGGRASLRFENAGFPAYEPAVGDEPGIFGVVTWGIRRIGKGSRA